MITIQVPVEIKITYLPLRLVTRSAHRDEFKPPQWLRSLEEDDAIVDVRIAVNRFLYSEN